MAVDTKGIKILLAEDDSNLGFVVKDNLKSNGYDVTLCEDGEIALKTFAAENLLHFQREEPFALLLRIRCRHATNHAGKQSENDRGEFH